MRLRITLVATAMVAATATLGLSQTAAHADDTLPPYAPSEYCNVLVKAYPGCTKVNPDPINWGKHPANIRVRQEASQWNQSVTTTDPGDGSTLQLSADLTLFYYKWRHDGKVWTSPFESRTCFVVDTPTPDFKGVFAKIRFNAVGSFRQLNRTEDKYVSGQGSVQCVQSDILLKSRDWMLMKNWPRWEATGSVDFGSGQPGYDFNWTINNAKQSLVKYLHPTRDTVIGDPVHIWNVWE